MIYTGKESVYIWDDGISYGKDQFAVPYTQVGAVYVIRIPLDSLDHDGCPYIWRGSK